MNVLWMEIQNNKPFHETNKKIRISFLENFFLIFFEPQFLWTYLHLLRTYSVFYSVKQIEDWVNHKVWISTVDKVLHMMDSVPSLFYDHYKINPDPVPLDKWWESRVVLGPHWRLNTTVHSYNWDNYSYSLRIYSLTKGITVWLHTSCMSWKDFF